MNGSNARGWGKIWPAILITVLGTLMGLVGHLLVKAAELERWRGGIETSLEHEIDERRRDSGKIDRILEHLIERRGDRNANH